ncbi:MAG: DNA internalization-related competence protein ComEC/Rec2, partial [Firmicutes bacterium]|nr:DNA internalization-related competence protein ComEC/Rec2 [Bacillota bacterium]
MRFLSSCWELLWTRPPVALAGAFTLGILASGFKILALPGVLILGMLALAAVPCARRRSGTAAGIALLAAFFAAGWARGLAALDLPRSDLDARAGHYVTLTGLVAEAPDPRPDRVHYVLRCGRTLVLAQVPRGLPEWGYGDLVEATGLLLVPRDPGNPGEFDYRAYLLRRGIKYLLKVESPGDVRRVGYGGGPVLRAALALRDRMALVFDRTMPPDQAALLKGMVLGVRGEIEPRVVEAMVRTGVVHVLSVSGLHVGFVLGFWIAVARGLRLARGPLFAGSVLVLFLYTLMTGAGPPVVRAAVMAVLALGAWTLGRERDWPTALALAALVLLVRQPQVLYDPGFQLSFAATWGILYLVPVAGGRLPSWLTGALVVPLAAQLAVWPLVAQYYHVFSPVALLANLLAVPLTAGIMALGFASAAGGTVFLPLAEALNATTGLLLGLFTAANEWLSGLPGAWWYVGSPSPALAALWYPLLWAAGQLAYRPSWRGALAGQRGRLARALVWAPAVFLALLLAWPPAERGLTCYFLDVGQGDAAVLVTPAGRTVVVDAGGWPGEFETGRGAGERVVAPFLRHLGVRRVDVLVLTHGHEDHAAGARALLTDLPVGLVVVGPERPGAGAAPGYAALLAEAAARGVPVARAAAGDRIAVDPGLDMVVLHPPAHAPRYNRAEENNGSLVLRVSYAGTALLLAADVEAEAQADLLASGAELAADILKVPHHGSRSLDP